MARLQASDLEALFDACFLASHRTVLRGGADEPLYAPSAAPEQEPHRVVYRADYASSALHEVAHWCIAGAARRRQPDYGYWYAPDGRSPEQQSAFERVEVKPQALESIFAEAAGVPFVLSADNLDGDPSPSPAFARAVAERRDRYLEEGLPRRAAIFLRALHERAMPGPSGRSVVPA